MRREISTLLRRRSIHIRVDTAGNEIFPAVAHWIKCDDFTNQKNKGCVQRKQWRRPQVSNTRTCRAVCHYDALEREGTRSQSNCHSPIFTAQMKDPVSSIKDGIKFLAVPPSVTIISTTTSIYLYSSYVPLLSCSPIPKYTPDGSGQTNLHFSITAQNIPTLETCHAIGRILQHGFFLIRFFTSFSLCWDDVLFFNWRGTM